MGGKVSYESKKKYQDKAYDRVNLVLHKGQKQILQDYAAKRGLSLNALFITAVQEKMERENENVDFSKNASDPV